MPDSPDNPTPLTPINQEPNLDLAGFLQLYYLPVEDLLADPVVMNGAIVGDLALRPGATWLELKLTQQTLKVAEVPKTDRHGTYYQVKVTGQRPQPTADVLGGFEALDPRPLVVLVRQANGQLRMLGTREAYLRLQAGTEGGGVAARAGLDVQLTGETPERGPYYAGVVPIPGGTAIIPIEAQVGSVRVLNFKGELMAIVPAGRDLVISSGFRVALSIQ